MHVSIKHNTTAENDTRAWWALAPTAPPAGLPIPYPNIAMKHGSSGTHVRNVQRGLKEWGWTLVVDGVFGPKTTAAVVEFQKQERLQSDGIVGPKTWAALWRA